MGHPRRKGREWGHQGSPVADLDGRVVGRVLVRFLADWTHVSFPGSRFFLNCNCLHISNLCCDHRWVGASLQQPLLSTQRFPPSPLAATFRFLRASPQETRHGPVGVRDASVGSRALCSKCAQRRHEIAGFWEHCRMCGLMTRTLVRRLLLRAVPC
jgi:hypothetical protein